MTDSGHMIIGVPCEDTSNPEFRSMMEVRRGVEIPRGFREMSHKEVTAQKMKNAAAALSYINEPMALDIEVGANMLLAQPDSERESLAGLN